MRGPLFALVQRNISYMKDMKVLMEYMCECGVGADVPMCVVAE
jgi:hypothetical protein